MSSRAWTAILGLLLCSPPVAAAQAPAGDRKQAMALRVPDGSIRLDGRLDEEVWRRAVAVTDFRLTDTQQYVTTLSGGRPETYNSRYVFAFIDRSTLSTELRMTLTLKPDVNLDFYAEPISGLASTRSRSRFRVSTRSSAKGSCSKGHLPRRSTRRWPLDRLKRP